MPAPQRTGHSCCLGRSASRRSISYEPGRADHARGDAGAVRGSACVPISWVGYLFLLRRAAPSPARAWIGGGIFFFIFGVLLSGRRTRRGVSGEVRPPRNRAGQVWSSTSGALCVFVRTRVDGRGERGSPLLFCMLCVGHRTGEVRSRRPASRASVHNRPEKVRKKLREDGGPFSVEFRQREGARANIQLTFEVSSSTGGGRLKKKSEETTYNSCCLIRVIGKMAVRVFGVRGGFFFCVLKNADGKTGRLAVVFRAEDEVFSFLGGWGFFFFWSARSRPPGGGFSRRVGDSEGALSGGGGGRPSPKASSPRARFAPTGASESATG